MSIFSDKLKNYIKNKGIAVRSLAEHCGIERSTLYKFMNGERVPGSEEIVESMARFMRLTPEETGRLNTSWKIAQMGEEAYYARKSMENFICHFPAVLAGRTQLSADGSALKPAEADASGTVEPAASAVAAAASAADVFSVFPAEKACISLSSEYQVNSCVHAMLLAECGKAQGEISLFLQPDYAFLFDLLASIQPTGDVHISHILCLNDHENFTEDHEPTSLRYLQKLFPVYMNRLQYDIYYFYDNIASHFYNFALLPCLILTSGGAVLCSADYQRGIFFREKAAVESLKEQFSSYLEKCAPLFTGMQIRPEDYLSMGQFAYSTSTVETFFAAIEPESCLFPFITDELLAENIDGQLPGVDEIFALARETFDINRQRLATGKQKIYFTEEGILHFAKTGRIREIPDRFYRPLDTAQRISVLEKMLPICEEGAYRMLGQPLNHLPANLHLYVWGANGGAVNYLTNGGAAVMLLIHEAGLVGMFRDYLNNMDEDGLVPTAEAAGKIANILQKLKEAAD